MRTAGSRLSVGTEFAPISSADSRFSGFHLTSPEQRPTCGRSTAAIPPESPCPAKSSGFPMASQFRRDFFIGMRASVPIIVSAAPFGMLFGALAVDTKFSLPDDALDMAEGELREARLEEAVDPHIVLVLRHHELLHAGREHLRGHGLDLGARRRIRDRRLAWRGLARTCGPRRGMVRLRVARRLGAHDLVLRRTRPGPGRAARIVAWALALRGA